jgi:tol-pal system protein YbgF
MTPLARRTGALPLLLAALLALPAGPSAAALFGDDEARKAILDLRARVNQNDEALRAQVAELTAANARLTEQVAGLTALRASLLELNNQIESLRAEVAKLRGSDEQLAREVAELQSRQRDVGQALDDRLRKLEPAKVSLDGREFQVATDEKQAYDDALATMRGGDFDKAAAMLQAFQRRWPDSGYADSVRFWLGNALYGKRDYKGAVAAFRTFVTASPKHPRAPEALLALANSQAEMKDPKAARRTIEELLKSYPQSEAAVAGKERLAALK